MSSYFKLWICLFSLYFQFEAKFLSFEFLTDRILLIFLDTNWSVFLPFSLNYLIVLE